MTLKKALHREKSSCIIFDKVGVYIQKYDKIWKNIW